MREHDVESGLPGLEVERAGAERGGPAMADRATGLDRTDSFGALGEFRVGTRRFRIARLASLEDAGLCRLSKLPYSIRILLEDLVRHEDGLIATAENVRSLAAWAPGPLPDRDIPFLPSRVLLQDFTGVPVLVDLAAMRDAARALGGDPTRVNPVMPVDLVVDHSVQVDAFGSKEAFRVNADREYGRNGERYAFLRWGAKAFRQYRAVPPDTGIVHQVNLEYLATVVGTRAEGRETWAFPDTVVGTDSHTTMVNGLGVLGWGVGGIEAEAAMLGQPMGMRIPEVVGVRLSGTLREGATATDAVLTVTELLRKVGVVEKFVEFFGPGLSALSLPDRATIANMSPEYGATMGYFPVDAETLRYLRLSGRPEEVVALVEAYAKEQGLFRTDDAPEPLYTKVVDLDLGSMVPSLAGPKRPQDRIPLPQVAESFRRALTQPTKDRGFALPPAAVTQKAPVPVDSETVEIGHGAVAIAAITSCTNTSNPSVMIGAGLLAQKAVGRGLRSAPWVKTSLAPGSRVVVDYLEKAHVMPALESLGFHLVGFGCTTCIGNSGPLPEPVAKAVKDGDLVVAAVLSGNRNFEGRVNPLVRANYLASPPLVVAYALAGRVDLDLEREPIGTDRSGQPVMLRDIWPTAEEVREAVERAVRPEDFRTRYGAVFEGDERWRKLRVPKGALFAWDKKSTYIRRAPYFDRIRKTPAAPGDIRGARVLVLLGDSVTTDHISPAGAIEPEGPAARYLRERGVEPEDFNQYGTRRGNHEVMMRGTFANVRLKNLLVPGVEGGVTVHLPDRERATIYDAATRYAGERIPLVVLAGKEYGSGSSRDWAAKGPALLGVRAVIAESFERIHRSNLVGMGVLPLEFPAGQGAASLGLSGEELFDIEGIEEGLTARKSLRVRARKPGGSPVEFQAVARVDTALELDYYRNGGILPAVLRQLVGAGRAPKAPARRKPARRKPARKSRRPAAKKRRRR